MRYVVDHDFHIHSYLSICGDHPEQTAEKILSCAEKNGLKSICVTDHLWDHDVPMIVEHAFYRAQPYTRGKEILPLPKSDRTQFFFGVETDMNKRDQIGLTKADIDELAFIIVPTTHMHFRQFLPDHVGGCDDIAGRARLWVDRFDALLDQDLPFHKMGVAHLTGALINYNYEEKRPMHTAVLRAIPEAEYRRVFTRAAKAGIGIELNTSVAFDDPQRCEVELMPFHIAKEAGCKFYLGSDAHSPGPFETFVERAEKFIDLLGLTEDDKMPLPGLKG